MKRFLIVKTSAFGDIIHTFPVIDYLKAKFPDSQIDWIVEEHCADLVRNHPFIERTLCVHTRLWRKSLLRGAPWMQMKAFRRTLRDREYDCVFDLQGNMKSGILTMQARSRNKVGFGRASVFEWPNLLFTNCRYNPPQGHNVRDEYLYLVQNFFNDKQLYESTPISLRISEEQQQVIQGILAGPQKRKVMVCAGSAWPNKQMTEGELALFLKEVQQHLQCAFLFVWGSSTEQQAAQRLQCQFPEDAQLIEKLPLPTLQNLMHHLDLVIAMDSLPLHLAGTTSTPTFSIFGPSSAEKFKPKGPQHATFQGSCPYGRTFERRCPVLRSCSTGLCTRGLTGNEVFQSFLHFWSIKTAI